MEEWPQTDQEDRVLKVLRTLDKQLKKAERISDPNKLTNALKSISEKLKEAKALIKEFEREARTDGMPAEILRERKSVLASQINDMLKRKKDIATNANRDDLFAGAAPQEEQNIEMQSVQQLIQTGQRDMKDTEATLNRAERLVEDTLQTGTNTAAALVDQTNQLNKLIDEVTDIEFNVKKATKVITDITRGMLTDKCIGFLLFLAVAAVIVLIVLKIIKPNKKNIAAGISTINNATNASGLIGNIVDQIKNGTASAASGAANSLPSSGRRLLRDAANHILPHLLQDDDW